MHDIIKKVVSKLLINSRKYIYQYLYKDYNTDPFNVTFKKIDKKKYKELYVYVKNNKDVGFISAIANDFKYTIDTEFLDKLALTTQIVVKKSIPSYNHGYLLYGAVRKYVDEHKNLNCINILETGTARGFSAIVMAKALSDAKKFGKVITIDILPIHSFIFWNCIKDIDDKNTRFSLLEEWKFLVDDYIIFVQGYTDVVLNRLGIGRINIAFIDGAHDYDSVYYELKYVASFQKSADVIICDDYTPKIYPGVAKAVNDFINCYNYSLKLYTDASKRGYAYLLKR